MKRLFSALAIILFVLCSCSLQMTKPESTISVQQEVPVSEERSSLKKRFANGKATMADLHTLFASEKILFNEIREQILLSEDGGFYAAYFLHGEIVFGDKRGSSIHVPENLQKKVSEFFAIVGSKQNPSVSLKHTGENIDVCFSFWLPKSVRAGIIHSSTPAIQWYKIEGDWYLFSEEPE